MPYRVSVRVIVFEGGKWGADSGWGTGGGVRAGAMGFGTSFARFTVPERDKPNYEFTLHKKCRCRTSLENLPQGRGLFVASFNLMGGCQPQMRPDTSEYLAELRTLPGKRRKFLELFYVFCPLWLFNSCGHYRDVRSFRVIQPVMDTESPEGGRRRGLVVEFCRDLRFGFAI